MPPSWLQQTFTFARQIYGLTKNSERHDAEIKELRDEVRKLAALVQDLIFERRQDRERAEHARQLAEKDRELLVLRLEAKLLRYERRLPPPGNSDEDQS